MQLEQQRQQQWPRDNKTEELPSGSEGKQAKSKPFFLHCLICVATRRWHLHLWGSFPTSYSLVKKSPQKKSAQLTSIWFQIQSGQQWGLMSQRGPASAGWRDSQLFEEEAFKVTCTDGCTLCWLADKGILPYGCWWEGFPGFIKTRYTISVQWALNWVPLPVECDMYSVWPGEPFCLWGIRAFSDFRNPHFHFAGRATKNPTWL